MAMQYTKLFEPVALALAAATIMTVPTTAAFVLRGGIVRLTNTTAGAINATLYSVPLAGGAAATNTFFPTKAVPANDYVDVQVPQMKAGDFLQGFAAAAGVNIQAIAGSLYS